MHKIPKGGGDGKGGQYKRGESEREKGQKRSCLSCTILLLGQRARIFFSLFVLPCLLCQTSLFENVDKGIPNEG